MKGIIGITGRVGSGKTGFALGCGLLPNQIALFDFNGKPAGVDGLAVEKYYAGDMAKKKYSQVARSFLSEIEALPKKKGLRCVIIDNWAALSQCIYEYFVSSPKEVLKNLEELAKNGRIKAQQVKGFRRHFEARMLADLGSVYDFVFVIAPLKERSQGKGDSFRFTGEYEPAWLSPTFEVFTSAFWLWRTSNNTPTALVVKQPPLRLVEGGRINTMPFLPDKITRLALGNESGYVSLWDIIAHYEKNPFDPNGTPFPHEVLSQKEKQLIALTLSEDELDLLEEDRRESIAEAIVSNEGKPLPEVAKIVSKVLGYQVPITEVLQVKNKMT